MKCLPGLILLLTVWLLSFTSWAADTSSSAGSGEASTEQSGSGGSSDQSTGDESGEEEPDCE